MNLVHRHIANWANEVLKVSPVLVIEGARQVGKSTLATVLGDEPKVFTTMDDEITRTFARDDPEGFLASAGESPLVIDEIQRCPEIILPLKAAVDRDRRPGRFIVTGSANLLRVPQAEDSLAGRAMTIRLHPFSQGEREGTQDDWVSKVLAGEFNLEQLSDRGEIVNRVSVGGYPLVQNMSAKMRSAWLKNYADRLVERDARDFGSAQVPTMRRLLNILAAAPGAEIVHEKLAQDLGISRATVARYLDILESLFLIYRLPAWSRNLANRQIQRSKSYITDTGLAAALSGMTETHLASIQGSDHLGPLVENFVVCELLRQKGWSETDFDLAHFRDRHGAEVDIVIETPRGIIAVEVKAATSATAAHFKHLAAMRDKLGSEFLYGIVLTTQRGGRAGDRLYSMPLSSLWSA